MGDMLWGACKYCKKDGPLNVTYFSFPINCDCCGHGHSIRIEHCNECEAVLPKQTKVWIDTEKLQDPIHQGLFTKGAFL